ncbi:hypothetical protein BG004_007487, partial [Podila humilis]
RIDPLARFNKESIAQLNALVGRIQMVVEANQHPRGMLKRISTMARHVIRRPSILDKDKEKDKEKGKEKEMENNNTSDTPPESPISPSTAVSVATSDYSYATTITTTPLATSANSAKLDEAAAIKVLGNTIETIKDRSVNKPSVPLTTTATESTADATLPPVPPEQSVTAETVVHPVVYNHNPNLQQHQRSAISDKGSIGSITLAPSSDSLTNDNNNNNNNNNNNTKPQHGRERSAASQKFLEEREARKATLRLGAQAFIASKAESLQSGQLHSPTYISRPSIDRLRTITRRETEAKPPVKSLISFWEQTTDPIEV